MMNILLLIASQWSWSIPIELGASYSYKKTFYDSDNYVESESPSASISFYLFDRIALETSYTRGIAVKKEFVPANGYPSRTTTQTSEIYGADIIFLIVNDRKALFQPFVKGGFANVKKVQTVQDEGQPSFEITSKPTVSPSYGIGIKIVITETLSMRASWDVVTTPSDGAGSINDSTGRVGLTWMIN